MVQQATQLTAPIATVEIFTSSAVTGWNAGASQFKDGINFAAQVNNVVKNNPQYTGYSMSTSGHSVGEGFAQMFSYIFGWGGVGYDGIGAGAIIGSAGFNQYLASQNITAVGGTNFISCNTSGLFNVSGLLTPGGGLVRAIALKNHFKSVCCVFSFASKGLPIINLNK